MRSINTLILRTLVSALCCGAAVIPAPAQTQVMGVICYFDGDYSSLDAIPDITAYDDVDPMIGYLDSLRRVLGSVSRNYVLMNCISGNAFSQLVKSSKALTNMIVVNRSYYQKGYTNTAEKKAAVLFVLSHEFAHCLHQDNMYLNDNSRYVNYMKEIRADERAGYTLSRLSDVGIQFIEDLLRRTTHSDARDIAHPGVSYRMLVAKAGWTEGITESSPMGKKVVVHGRSFIRFQLDDQSIACGEIDAAGKAIGVWKVIWPDKDLFWCYETGAGEYPGIAVRIFKQAGKMDIYLGQQQNDKCFGKGLKLCENKSWYNGLWKDGEIISGEWLASDSSKYNGDFLHSQFNGQGRYESKDGMTTYQGAWKNGLYDGKGILVTGGITQNGLFKEGRFVGNTADR